MDDNHFYRIMAVEMLIQAIRIAKGEITNVIRLLRDDGFPAFKCINNQQPVYGLPYKD